MIIGFFLFIITWVLMAVAAVLPVVNFPSEIIDSLYLFWSFGGQYSWLVPFTTMKLTLTFAILYQIVKYAWFFGWKIYGAIRG